jgi:hypothetical protein
MRTVRYLAPNYEIRRGSRDSVRKKNEAATRIVASQDRKVYPYRLTAGMCESSARTLMSKEQNDEDNPYSIPNRKREKCS